jgi:hypothetical protein
MALFKSKSVVNCHKITHSILLVICGFMFYLCTCLNGMYKLKTIYINILISDLIFIMNFTTWYILIIYINFIYVRFGVITAIRRNINKCLPVLDDIHSNRQRSKKLNGSTSPPPPSYRCNSKPQSLQMAKMKH